MATGHVAGIECPQCKQGKLEAVLRSVSAGQTTRGVVGLNMSKSIIDHLACSSCFLMYAAVDRGHTLRDILERQLKGFQNPPEKLKACPACAKELVTQTSHSQIQMSPEPYYMYCDPCQKIFWVFTWEEKNPGMKKMLDKMKIDQPL